MSKSYDNTIELFLEEKALRKKIMGIVTDSTPVEAPKDPATSAIVALYRLFARRCGRRADGGGFPRGRYRLRRFQEAALRRDLGILRAACGRGARNWRPTPDHVDRVLADRRASERADSRAVAGDGCGCAERVGLR